MELLPAIVGLAVVDSINPSALLATVALLLRGRRARPLVAVYLVAVLTTYFATGVVLILGFGLTPRAVIESDAAYLAQGVLGAAMLAYALAAPGAGASVVPPNPQGCRRPRARWRSSPWAWPSPCWSCRRLCRTWARWERSSAPTSR